MTNAILENHLRQKFEAELPARIQRIEELNYQPVIGGHYFAPASSQCLELYRDGYMLGCIMCSQALLEAMLKFVAQQNSMEYKKDVRDLIQDILAKNILSSNTVAAAKSAWSHRNDFHHLNQGLAGIDLMNKAKECVEATCAVEDEIFEAVFSNGALVPKKPIYWDIKPDGTVPVFLRRLDV